MAYERHPDPVLCKLFEEKPFQGVQPGDARFLFVGLDANYDQRISHSPLFPRIVQYHQDPVRFWRDHGVHHPFLLPGYKGPGRKYHQNFSQIGFTARDADRVCFIELLHVPTVGRNRLAGSDLDARHLRRIRTAIFERTPKHVFIPDGVQRLMYASGMFPEMQNPVRSDDVLPILYKSNNCTVRKHLHFSVYGRYEEQRVAQATAIAHLSSMG